MKQIELNKLLEEHPLLTSNGYLCDRNDDRYEQNREYLRNALGEVETCISWLLQCNKSSTMHPVSSYGLKHRVERYYDTYVTNGAFIAAVLYLGIKYRIIDYPNIAVWISKKTPNL